MSENKESGKKISECVLSQSIFTVAGILLGTAGGYRYKSYKPLIIMSGLGTALDLIYARNVACKTIIDEYYSAKRKIKVELEKNKID